MAGSPPRRRKPPNKNLYCLVDNLLRFKARGVHPPQKNRLKAEPPGRKAQIPQTGPQAEPENYGGT